MSFQAALVDSVERLGRLKAQGLLDDFLVIGAFALARVASPRATGDIDFAIRTRYEMPAIAKILGGEGKKGDVSDPLFGCVAFTSGESLPVPVHLIQFPPAIEEAAFWEPERKVFENVEIPFASAKALLLLKLYAGSPLDLQDAENILRVKQIDQATLSAVKAFASRLRLSRRFAQVLERASSD